MRNKIRGLFYGKESFPSHFFSPLKIIFLCEQYSSNGNSYSFAGLDYFNPLIFLKLFFQWEVCGACLDWGI